MGFSISLLARITSRYQANQYGLSATRSLCVSSPVLCSNRFGLQANVEKRLQCLPRQPTCSGLCPTVSRSWWLEFVAFLAHSCHLRVWLGSGTRQGLSYNTSVPAWDWALLVTIAISVCLTCIVTLTFLYLSCLSVYRNFRARNRNISGGLLSL